MNKHPNLYFDNEGVIARFRDTLNGGKSLALRTQKLLLDDYDRLLVAVIEKSRTHPFVR